MEVKKVNTPERRERCSFCGTKEQHTLGEHGEVVKREWGCSCQDYKETTDMEKDVKRLAHVALKTWERMERANFGIAQSEPDWVATARKYHTGKV